MVRSPSLLVCGGLFRVDGQYRCFWVTDLSNRLLHYARLLTMVRNIYTNRLVPRFKYETPSYIPPIDSGERCTCYRIWLFGVLANKLGALARGYGVWNILPSETTGHFFLELFDIIYLDRVLTFVALWRQSVST